MLERQVEYNHDGDTYIGEFKVTGRDDAATVTVCFGATEISAKVGRLAPRIAARTLLGELVRETMSGASNVRPIRSPSVPSREAIQPRPPHERRHRSTNG